MLRSPPRHLAPSDRARTPARRHLLAESILAVVAIGLTTAVVLGSVLGGPESSAARLPNPLPVAPTTTKAGATIPSSAGQGIGILLADAGFVATIGGWQALGGAGLERVEQGRDRRPALRLTAGATLWPGTRHERVAKVTPGRRYEAIAWVRASRPGVEVRGNLYELRGGQRFAVDTAGATADPRSWQPVRLAYDAPQPDAVLAVELLAPGLADDASLLVDDLTVRSVPTTR